MKRIAKRIWNWPWAALLAVAWPMCGVALVGYGAYRIYEPAGFIAVGVLIVLDNLHAQRGSAQ